MRGGAPGAHAHVAAWKFRRAAFIRALHREVNRDVVATYPALAQDQRYARFVSVSQRPYWREFQKRVSRQFLATAVGRVLARAQGDAALRWRGGVWANRLRQAGGRRQALVAWCMGAAGGA